MLLVLDFSLSQSGAVVDAPVDGLQSAVNEALFKETVERLKGTRFIVAGHGFVRRLPAAEAADALELGGLQVDILLGVGAAGIQNGRSGHLQFLTAELFVDLDFDG